MSAAAAADAGAAGRGQPWYAGGLAFSCRRCRACCRGEPGYVWVGAGEVRALAAELGMEAGRFRAGFCRSVGGRVSLRERADGDCVLLGPEGCRAYAARPAQCRTFPFWPEHLAGPADWAALARSCPGVNSGPVRNLEEIRAALAGQADVGE